MRDINVQDTAFWMAACRASDASLSLDTLAHHWVTPDALAIAKLYLKEVSPSENVMMCLRNRFFLTSLNRFLSEHPNGTFINIAAGVTSYPYLIEPPVRCLEVDCEPVTAFKRQRMTELRKQGLVDSRQVDFVSCNLNDSEQLRSLESYLKEWISGPTFILVEGVIYYLRREAVDSLLAVTGRCQRAGSELGIVSWMPSFEASVFYQRFALFLEARLGQQVGKYTFFENEYFHRLPGYRVLTHTDNPALIQKYQPQTALSELGPYADEQLFLLQKL